MHYNKYTKLKIIKKKSVEQKLYVNLEIKTSISIWSHISDNKTKYATW